MTENKTTLFDKYYRQASNVIRKKAERERREAEIERNRELKREREIQKILTKGKQAFEKKFSLAVEESKPTITVFEWNVNHHDRLTSDEHAAAERLVEYFTSGGLNARLGWGGDERSTQGYVSVSLEAIYKKLKGEGAKDENIVDRNQGS